jgi:hypothetical protein
VETLTVQIDKSKLTVEIGLLFLIEEIISSVISLKKCELLNVGQMSFSLSFTSADGDRLDLAPPRCQHVRT